MSIVHELLPPYEILCDDCKDPPTIIAVSVLPQYKNRMVCARHAQELRNDPTTKGEYTYYRIVWPPATRRTASR